MSWIIRRYKIGYIVPGANSIDINKLGEGINEIPGIFNPEFNCQRLIRYYEDVLDHNFLLEDIFSTILSSDKQFERAIAIIKKILSMDKTNIEALEALKQILSAIKREDLICKLDKKV